MAPCREWVNVANITPKIGKVEINPLEKEKIKSHPYLWLKKSFY